MGNTIKPSGSKAKPLADNVSQPPIDTAELRKGLKAFLDQRIDDPLTHASSRLGSYTFGVYVFYDYDGEPIYVGQTRDQLSSRIGRHLTNQRTDAVAMSVLDPFEVCDIAVYPAFHLQGKQTNDPAIRDYLNALEATVYLNVLNESAFHAVLNEKAPTSSVTVPIPEPTRGRIVTSEMMKLRSHPDTRIARRAATLARLAQVISERKVAPGLRQVLVLQATRLKALAERRSASAAGDSDDEDPPAEESAIAEGDE